jgi:nucleoid DNA-binding protein
MARLSNPKTEKGLSMKTSKTLFALSCAVVLIAASPAYAASSASLNESLATRSNTSPEAAAATVAEVFEAIEAELLAGREVSIRSFGTFYLQKRDARTGRNPKTGEPIEIPAKRYPRFRSSDLLKDSMNR